MMIVVSYMIKKIRNIILGSKISIEAVFTEHCSDRQVMDTGDFRRFVRKYVEKAEEHEIDSLMRHFTQEKGRGTIMLQEFMDAFGRDVKDQSFKIGIEDIVKPLQTKINRFNVNMSALFDKYDKNRNGRLSAEELADALRQDMNIQLQEDEVAGVKEYFKNKYGTLEINKCDFIEMLKAKFERKCDAEDAKKALALVKQRMTTVGKTPMQVMNTFDMEKTKRLSLRNFKMAVHSLKTLS